MRELADRAAAQPRAIEVGGSDRRRGARRDGVGIDPQAERERTEHGQLRGGIAAVEIDARIGLGVAARTGIGDRLVQRAAGRFHPRQHRIGGAVQDGDNARDAIAGEAVADRADDRHRAADRRLEPQLTSLTAGQREQRRAVPRDDLFVRGDDRLAGEERGANPVGRRLDAADRLDHHVDVADEHLIDARRPPDARCRRQGVGFLVGAAIDDMGELEAVRWVRASQTTGDGGTDGATTKDCDTTACRTHSISSSPLRCPPCGH